MAKRRLKVCYVEDDQGQPREEPTTQYPTQPQVSLSSHQPNATSQILVDDVDQMIDVEVEICVEDSSGSRKTRGVTRMFNIWNLSPEMRILVKFNDLYQPVDTEGSVLHRFMGTIVRKPNLLPIDCFNWRKMDAKYKEYCSKILESKFSFPQDPRDPRTSEMIQRITMKKLGDLWRNFKCELKSKYFDESLQKNTILMKAPAWVNRAQFDKLVDFWFSNEGKERSRKNRHNRDQQMDFYAAGSKSIAQYAYNMIEEIAGNINLKRSSASDSCRVGKGASVLEQQGFQATEAAQSRPRRHLRKGFGQTMWRRKSSKMTIDGFHTTRKLQLH